MRPTRIETSDFPYHITARGNNQNTLFYDDEDRHYYINLLCASKKQFDYRIYSYCLMDNHIHLFLQMMGGTRLARLMHWIQLGFARYFNRRNNHRGHVFGGRYFSNVVETDHYLLAVDRYIHLNPVHAGMVQRPEDFLWSSYRSRLSEAGQAATPWIDHASILDSVGSNPAARLEAYRRFTEDGIQRRPQWSDSHLAKTSFIGSAAFALRVCLAPTTPLLNAG